MPDVKISQLPEVSSMSTSDVLPVVAGIQTSKITLQNLANVIPQVSSSISASFSSTSVTSSLSITSVSASNAITASYALNAPFSPTFPYTGSAIISGSLGITGSLNLNSLSTIDQYTLLKQVSQSLSFADDAAAAVGGVPLGGLYRSGNFVLIRLV